MLSTQDVLQKAAESESILELLEKNVYTEFPVTPANGSATNADDLGSQPRDPAAQRPTLPAQLSSSYSFIKKTLTEHFATHPPHTIQRLAELVLHPRQHYRLLYPYLNALDRAVSVSSGNDIFPLTTHVNGTADSGHQNGTSSHADDSIGGALLTPIPWLRHSGSSGNDDSDGEPSPKRVRLNGSTPHGSEAIHHANAAALEEALREEGAVSEGELLRQQQEHMDPPTPIASAATRAQASSGSVAASLQSDEEHESKHASIEATIEKAEDEPHARGPKRSAWRTRVHKIMHSDLVQNWIWRLRWVARGSQSLSTATRPPRGLERQNEQL
ncbi:hypothetical protein MRB53_040347 [Persea americana]|nr:hypothetical protein MRB53_040347 [Persea americana]